jgi:hypothetical protein
MEAIGGRGASSRRRRKRNPFVPNQILVDGGPQSSVSISLSESDPIEASEGDFVASSLPEAAIPLVAQSMIPYVPDKAVPHATLPKASALGSGVDLLVSNPAPILLSHGSAVESQADRVALEASKLLAIQGELGVSVNCEISEMVARLVVVEERDRKVLEDQADNQGYQ